MGSLGQRLREERIKQGKELRSIAEDLRIGSRYLEAIEAEDWKQLPGAFFNRSFLRQYAQALGMDAQSVEQEYLALVRTESGPDMEMFAAVNDPRAKLEEERRLISVEPLRTSGGGFFDSRTGLAAVALILLVAGGGAISLVIDRWNSAREARDQNNAQVQAPVVPAPKAATQPATEAADSAAQPGEAGAPSLTAVTNPSDPSSLTLNIEATEQTWIEVTADGKRIFMGVLEPGEKKFISTMQNRARMVVGNAGGIAVRKGGQDIGPIGPRGQVRTVNITPEKVEIVEPKKPAANGTV